jgi:flagellar hook-associated protein 2
MSSGITFSGFNDIDFNTVLNALMTHAALPLNTLQGQQAALKNQLGTFDAFRSRVEAARSASDGLGTMQAVSTMAARSSHASNVTVSSTSAAEPGHYDIVVTSLARAQVTASVETFADADTTIVASGGSITIGGTEVVLSGNTTLQGLATAINDTEDIGVTASVVRTGPGAYRLALQSNLTGTEHTFTVTSGLTDAAISFGANAVNASDAAITINNIAATSSSNTFENVVPGVTVTVLKADPATTVAVDVASDGSALADKINTFVNAYNNIVSFLESQRLSAGAGEASSIGHEPLLRQLRGALRTELMGVRGSGSMTRLAEIGIEFTRDGRLELNRKVFDAAVAADGDGVRALLAGTDGAFPAIESMLESYTTAAGMISVAKDRLNKQIRTMDGQILSMQNRLALQRDALQRQFTEADAAMSRLKSQSSALSGIGGGV